MPAHRWNSLVIATAAILLVQPAASWVTSPHVVRRRLPGSVASQRPRAPVALLAKKKKKAGGGDFDLDALEALENSLVGIEDAAEAPAEPAAAAPAAGRPPARRQDRGEEGE